MKWKQIEFSKLGADFILTNIYISYNHKQIPVTLIGTDQKLLPTLLKALRHNKLTIGKIKETLEKIDLFSAEAIVYSSQGDKFRIPIF
jgi:hypothetical protein